MSDKETPKQYSARHLRHAIERAKVAVIQAEEELQNFRGRPAAYQELLDSAFGKLDSAWRMAAEAERHARVTGGPDVFSGRDGDIRLQGNQSAPLWMNRMEAE